MLACASVMLGAIMLLVLATFGDASDALELVLLEQAARDDGALCIDGTPGGYYYRPGSGSGANKWVIGFLGGGWCHTEEQCLERSRTLYGSSRLWPRRLTHGLGITSGDPTANPATYNWNVAFLWYCDGQHYGGDLSAPYVVNGTQLYARGARIWRAALRELERRHDISQTASHVVLHGESAGGTACWTHLDALRERWPAVDVRGACDSSFFVVVPKYPPPHELSFLAKIKAVYDTFNVTSTVDQSCLAAMPNTPYLCLVASHLYRHISTPLFVLQSQIDCDQLENMELGCLPAPDNLPPGTAACNTSQLAYFANFQSEMRSRVATAGALMPKNGNGIFFDSCLHHSISLFGNYWNNAAYTVDNTTAAVALKSWLDGNRAVFVDQALFPDNKRCVAAFERCLGEIGPNRRYAPWQCGPESWQAHDC